MDQVRQIWDQANFGTNFVTPNVLYAYNQSGEKFIVIDDHSTIYRLMNQQGKVFMVAHFRCIKDQQNQHYICGDPFHIISCKKYDQDQDQYAYDRIIPIVFK